MIGIIHCFSLAQSSLPSGQMRNSTITWHTLDSSDISDHIMLFNIKSLTSLTSWLHVEFSLCCLCCCLQQDNGNSNDVAGICMSTSSYMPCQSVVHCQPPLWQGNAPSSPSVFAVDSTGSSTSYCQPVGFQVNVCV